jgi:tetratricopeptide (TPR) repeat protein
MAEIPVLTIFLSSPGDVSEERALAEIVFRRLADKMVDAVRLRLVIWEHEPLFAHTDFMSQMPQPSQCDLVVTILWSRLGTRLPTNWSPEPNLPAPTGTEWEVTDALKSYRAMGKPNLLIYRKIPGPRIGLGSVDFDERKQQWEMLDDFCRNAFFDAQGAIIVAHHAFADGHDFERQLSDHVRAWLDRQVHAGSADSTATWRGRSPFRGLEPFEAEHQAVFFGRSEALSALLGRIRDAEAAARSAATARLLLVQGMSGAGKTSLFKAGLLPLLELRPIEGIASWRVVTFRPSESEPQVREQGALGVLASRLCECLPSLLRLGTTVQKLAELLCDRPDEAVGRIETCLAAEAEQAGTTLARSRIVIYVDQLEEVFLAPEATATRLIRALVALARANATWVAATLRSDFSHRLEGYSDLVQCTRQVASYTLLPPHAGQFAEMIQEPARAAGLIWEQQDGISLDQALLRDASANPEALPLLEYTLAQLYERREGRLLRWSAYGGALQQALVCEADESVKASASAGEDAFRDLMRELVGVGVDGVATRRYAPMSRFPNGSEARALLERLVERRLCVTVDEGRGDGPVTRLAHESLIRAWPMAQDWLKQERLLLQVRDEIARDAEAWVRHDRKDGWLGVAPDKLAAIGQIERAGLMPADPAPDYARRSQSLATRNSWLRRAAVSAIAILAVVAGIAWWIAAQQRDIAQTQADTATRTTGFMVSLFQLADPTENQGKSVTAQEILKKGAAAINSSQGTNNLAHEPRVRAALLTAMGEAYSGLGLYGQSVDLLDHALASELSATVSDELRVRTLLAYGTALYLAGEYQKAQKPLTDAVDLSEKSLDPSSILDSRALTGLADDLAQLGNVPEAIRRDRQALAVDRKRTPADDATLANTLASLGSAYFYSGDLAAAEAPMRESLLLREKLFGLQDARTAEATNNLGALLYESGKFDASIVEYQQALRIERKVYGEKHPEIATTLSNMGRSQLVAGRLDEAESVTREALAMTRTFEGDTHDYLVSPLNTLAMIDTYRGRLEQAKQEIQEAVTIARLPDHGELLDQVLLNAADLDLSSGDLRGAQTLLSESRHALEAAHPASSANTWRYAVWDAVHARLMAALGDTAGAQGTLTRAQEILRSRFGPDGFYTMRAERTRQALKNTPPAG